jgi:hypothetical protein
MPTTPPSAAGAVGSPWGVLVRGVGGTWDGAKFMFGDGSAAAGAEVGIISAALTDATSGVAKGVTLAIESESRVLENAMVAVAVAWAEIGVGVSVMVGAAAMEVVGSGATALEGGRVGDGGRAAGEIMGEGGSKKVMFSICVGTKGLTRIIVQLPAVVHIFWILP